MRAKVLPNGDLEIRVDEQEQAQLREDRANAADPDSEVNFDSEQTMRAVLEPLITDDEYDWVRPEWIGALTDAPILGTFGEHRAVTDEDNCYMLAGQWENEAGELTRWMHPVTGAWWFEPYAVRSPLDDLADTGRCVFQRVELEEQDA